jgi:hypothetical protein
VQLGLRGDDVGLDVDAITDDRHCGFVATGLDAQDAGQSAS